MRNHCGSSTTEVEATQKPSAHARAKQKAAVEEAPLDAANVAKTFSAAFLGAALETPRQMLNMAVAGPAAVWRELKKHAEE